MKNYELKCENKGEMKKKKKKMYNRKIKITNKTK